MDKFEYKTVKLKSPITRFDLESISKENWEVVCTLNQEEIANGTITIEEVLLKRERKKVLTEFEEVIFYTTPHKPIYLHKELQESLNKGYEVISIHRDSGRGGEYYACMGKYEYL